MHRKIVQSPAEYFIIMHFVDSKGLLSAHNGMNIYRGCTHGCIYCDSRSRCYNFTHDFKDIEVKRNAPILLENALSRRRKRCMIGTGAMCDPYMHCESELRLTRQCLEIIDKYGFGLAIQTKSSRIERDLDLLQSINEKARCVVQMTLTTCDEQLCRILEPNVSTTAERMSTLELMRDHGIPTVAWLTPLLPFINDTEENIRGLMARCIRAGVKGIMIWNIGVTLREGDREYFYAALDRHFPGMKERYIRAFGSAYECVSPNSPALMAYIRRECARHGIICQPDELFKWLAHFPEDKHGTQMSLF